MTSGISASCFTGRRLDGFDEPESKDSVVTQRIPVFDIPNGYAYASLLIIAEVISYDGIHPLPLQVASCNRVVGKNGETMSWDQPYWQRNVFFEVTNWLRYWIETRINEDPMSESWSEKTTELMREISDRSECVVERVLAGQPEAWREVWRVPEGCDASTFIQYVFTKTKNRQAEQWFLFSAKTTKQKELVGAFFLYSLKFANEDEQEDSSELTCQIRKLLIQWNGMPAIVLFGCRSALMIGDHFAKKFPLTDKDASVDKVIESILEEAFVVAVEYSVSAVPAEWSPSRQPATGYHESVIAGDALYARLMKMDMEVPMERVKMGDLLRRFLQYPAVFLRECGYSEQVVKGTAQLIETRLEKIESRMKSSEFSGCTVPDIVSAYQQYKRLTHWIVHYLKAVQDPCNTREISGMLSALPWRSPTCVELSGEVGHWGLEKEDDTDMLEQLLETAFENVVPNPSGKQRDPGLVWDSYCVESMAVHMFIRENKEVFERISAASDVVYGTPGQWKLCANYVDWLSRIEFSNAF